MIPSPVGRNVGRPVGRFVARFGWHGAASVRVIRPNSTASVPLAFCNSLYFQVLCLRLEALRTANALEGVSGVGAPLGQSMARRERFERPPLRFVVKARFCREDVCPSLSMNPKDSGCAQPNLGRRDPSFPESVPAVRPGR